MGRSAEERTAARDFTLARLAIVRAAISKASIALDEALHHFLDPADDELGEDRAELLEAIDGELGAAAAAVQLAQASWDDVDPSEGEEEEDDDEEDGDDDEEEDDDDKADKKKGRR